MKVTLEVELKPCPFCGGKPEIHQTERWETYGGYFVMCRECLTSGNNYSSKNIAVEKWNRRVES